MQWEGQRAVRTYAEVKRKTVLNKLETCRKIVKDSGNCY